MKAAAGKILSPFMMEANKNKIDNSISLLPRRRAALPPYNTSTITRSMTLAVTFAPPNRPQPQQLKLRSNFSSNDIIIDETEGEELESVNINPCIDLLSFMDAEVKSSFRERSAYTERASASTHKYLTQQLLPLAWSHNPLTTLKLILYLGENIDDYEVFYTALVWLHHNHPKTLASNIEPLAGDYSAFEFVDIIYRLVLLQGISTQHSDSDDVGRRIRDKTIAIANKAAEMYHNDPDFQFLHDRVSDFFADHLKSDIEKLKKKKKKNQTNGDGDDGIKFSLAAAWLPYTGYKAATQLCESIARKLFPQEKEEAVRISRLKKEVLLPVRKMRCHKMICCDRKCEVKQYLEDVKAGCCEIKIDHGDESSSLLPHEVIGYVDDPDLGDVAQLQWTAMVEDLFNKGKWKNYLAVCYDLKGMSPLHQDVSMALVLLFSQLSEQPWKGKAVTLAPYPPQLRMIQGGDDLKSQCAFMRGMNRGGVSCRFKAVLDLILHEAVNANLKPEHMIKKVLVFTCYASTISKDYGCWPTIIREIRSKFEDKGYGNAVPHIVVWELGRWGDCVDPPSRLPGVTFLTGYTDDFIKLFLDNEGEVGPEHALEAAICGKQYLNLAVVD